MNDKNIIVNKPEPKPGILERGDLFAIAVGMVIGSGMVTLIGPAMAYTGFMEFSYGYEKRGIYECGRFTL